MNGYDEWGTDQQTVGRERELNKTERVIFGRERLLRGCRRKEIKTQAVDWFKSMHRTFELSSSARPTRKVARSIHIKRADK